VLDESNRTEPGHPSYTAALAYEATLRNTQEIYAAEPRDEKWATERAILDYTRASRTRIPAIRRRSQAASRSASTPG
jgi:hypothetical protein